MRLSICLGVILAASTLGGCQSAEPLTFNFKWFEGEAGFKWFTDCVGDSTPGTSGRGRIKIVDRATAKRLARRGPDAELTEEDLAGLRCFPPDETSEKGTEGERPNSERGGESPG